MRDNHSRAKRTAGPDRLPVPRRHCGSRTRALILTNDFITREGIAAIVHRDPRFVCSDAVQTFAEAENLVASNQVDLIIMEEPLTANDVHLQWIRRVSHAFSEIRIVVICRKSDSAYAERAIRAGVSGWCVRNGSAEGLLQAMRSVVDSGSAQLSISKFARLSERELEVFSLIGAGYGITEIARRLGISRKTVETHCEHLKTKLNHADAKELKRAARGLVDSK